MPNIEVIEGLVPVNWPLTKVDVRESVWRSPLDIAFSQNVIYPLFSNGGSVDEVVSQIRVREPSDDNVEADLVLEPPFPKIEVIWWCPKLRNGEGKPLLDEQGSERRGREALFSIDNRRLYALQRAAVARYPKTCVVEVSVITDKGEVARHLKKFRTRLNGLSITISEWNGVGRDNARDYTALRVWDWRSVVTQAEENGSCMVDAVEAGGCGSWEYLDAKGVVRGPFSNWQMREWWERRMFPSDLRIRPYVADLACREGANRDDPDSFRPVAEAFAEAPAPFASSHSPEAAATATDADWQECADCGRKRLEGWSARGQWYCAVCWKRWETKDDNA